MRSRDFYSGFGAALFLCSLAASVPSCGPTVALTLRPTCNITTPNGFNVYSSWGTHIVVDKTELCAAPSTYGPTPILEHKLVCDEGDRGSMSAGECRSRRGNFLEDGGFELAASGDVLGTLNNQNPNWVHNTGNFELATTSPIEILPELVLPVTSGLITKGDQHTQSHLPLNEKSTIIEALHTAGYITERSFSIDVGSEDFHSPRNGLLTFGGYNPSRVLGDFPKFDIDMDALKLEDTERYCPLQVNIDTVTVYINGKPFDLIFRDNKSPACIEMYDRLLRLPEISLKILRDALDGLQDVELIPPAGEHKDSRYENGDDGEILDPEPGLIFRSNNETSGVLTSMTIKIKDGPTVTLNERDLVQPLVGLSSDGTRVSNDSYSKIMVYQTAGQGLAPILGRAFLSKLLMYVNYDDRQFQLGLLDEESVSQGTTGQCTSPPSNSNKTPALSPAEIAGLVLGTVAFLLAAAAVLYWFFRVRKRLAEAETTKGELGRLQDEHQRHVDNMEIHRAPEDGGGGRERGVFEPPSRNRIPVPV
ncbi:hypothetical protein QBC37DRAFT_324644 [Rhypophila decipiens]|uniref:Peptidase A1 domain-containing protein n=1 Tax=Rhypophila decipiens TaxID=261697 RepID=A0AAN6XYP0_9PEZI|nr:hypothetical protein QBC37DRAFT_324644 [Rhypophila decipiens]